MARFRLGLALALSLLAIVAARADDAPMPAQLYDRPVLAVDPGTHTAPIRAVSTDRAGLWAITGSWDKTIRVWSLKDGALQRTIATPAGPGEIGQVHAAAMSSDGTLIAAGGWMRYYFGDKQEQVYIFDRETGTLLHRIDGLPGNADGLTFSSDGQILAATFSAGGLRIFERNNNWAELARDDKYAGRSYGVAIANDGRMATTSLDGKVRIYDKPVRGVLRPEAVFAAPAGSELFGLDFNFDGSKLAVGYNGRASVDLLDGRSAVPLSPPNLAALAYPWSSLLHVAWSRDGRALFAGGRIFLDGTNMILAWDQSGQAPWRWLPAGGQTISGLVPLPDDDLLVAAMDPWLGRLAPDGKPRWFKPNQVADFRGQATGLAVSPDGARVDFRFARTSNFQSRFDLATHTLQQLAHVDGLTAPPSLGTLKIDGWKNAANPTLDGRRLALERDEYARSLAVHPDGSRFVLGADWRLRAFDAAGKLLWSRAAPTGVWAVNITGDGRMVVAAHGDGTIRWHRMSDGVELLAFMPLADQTNWVAWTPEGYYDATAGARGVLRWRVNHGWDAPAESIPVEDIKGSYIPSLLPLVLKELETPRALGLAMLAEHNKEVMIRTNSRVAPGARLHLLAIGISAYNEDTARKLRLNFADRDAHDLASAIVGTQGALYTDVRPQLLTNKDANKPGILRALATMRTDMARSAGNDLAVVHFSGHGAIEDGKLYLLPYEVDARDAVGIKSTALSVDDLKTELVELAKHGRVLVLLDACHSGATTLDGASVPMDSTALRTSLTAANITVLTSSSDSQVSREKPEWQHGAFTKALLDALSDPEADPARNGLISTTSLGRYVTDHVASLTGGAQTPGIEIRYESTVFAETR